MQSGVKFLVLIIVFVLGLSLCNGQETGSPATEMPKTPYMAEVIGTDVRIRSGAGTVFYYCGKINAPARVTVVGHKFEWSEIVPPAGSFSWISKRYVEPDSSNPGIGIVTGDSVRVWAGSDLIEPMRSSSLQTKLNEGDTVTVGNLSFQVIHTPGHTQGGICLYGYGIVFTGDTLFRLSIGRYDMPGGDGRQLLNMIAAKLMVLPEETVALPGHGPGTRIGDEKQGNPFLNM